MPFAAIVGALAGSIAVALFLWFTMKLQGGYSEDGWFYLYIMPIITSAIFGYLYTLISCEMAPRGKLIAGTVMVTILGLFSLVCVVAAWATQNYPTGRAIQGTVGIVATMVAAVMTLVDASSKHQLGA